MEMRLHKFTAEGEAALKERGYDLYWLGTGAGSHWESLIDTLEGCEILWTVNSSSSCSSSSSSSSSGSMEFHGVMKHGSCCIGSQRIPGMSLTITDNLVLRHDALLVNDKGVDSSGRIIYGNYLDEAYHMLRVPPL